MRVQRVGQENRVKNTSALTAGAMGAAAGVLVRNLAPVTQEEFDFFVKTQGKDTVENISKFAKQARPVSYFAAAGALVALSAHVIANAFRSAVPKKETPKPETRDITMADAILEGLGSNTEILILANEAAKSKQDKLF